MLKFLLIFFYDPSFSSNLVLTEPISISQNGHLRVHNKNISIQSSISGNGKLTFLDHHPSLSNEQSFKLLKKNALLKDNELTFSDSGFLITGDCSEFTGDLHVKFGSVKFSQDLPKLQSLSLSNGLLSLNSLGFSDTPETILHVRLSQKFLPLQVYQKIDLSHIKKIVFLNLLALNADRSYQFFSAKKIISPLLGWKSVLPPPFQNTRVRIYKRKNIFYFKLVTQPRFFFFFPNSILPKNQNYSSLSFVNFSFSYGTHSFSGAHFQAAQELYLFAEERYEKNKMNMKKIKYQYKKFKKRIKKKEYRKVLTAPKKKTKKKKR